MAGSILGALALGVLVLSLAPSAQGAPAGAPRIINGADAEPGQFPYLVSLLDADKLASDGAFQAQFCGGTLTTEWTVVTAAHCVVDEKTGRLRRPAELFIGFEPNLRAPGLRAVAVGAIVPNPEYSRDSTSNDIAVITLVSAVNNVRVLAPASPTEAPAMSVVGNPVRVVGWGNTSASGARSFPADPRVGGMVVFPEATCAHGQPFTLNGVTFLGFTAKDVDPDSMLCASGTTDSGEVVDSCQGDSGGPLVAGTGQDARLLGIGELGSRMREPVPGHLHQGGCGVRLPGDEPRRSGSGTRGRTRHNS